jgi:hypothetical protein
VNVLVGVGQVRGQPVVRDGVQVVGHFGQPVGVSGVDGDSHLTGQPVGHPAALVGAVQAGIPLG